MVCILNHSLTSSQLDQYLSPVIKVKDSRGKVLAKESLQNLKKSITAKSKRLSHFNWTMIVSRSVEWININKISKLLLKQIREINGLLNYSYASTTEKDLTKIFNRINDVFLLLKKNGLHPDKETEIRESLKTSKLSRICGGLHRRWGVKLLTSEEAFRKMNSNAKKAIADHKKEIAGKQGLYGSSKDLIPIDFHEICYNPYAENMSTIELVTPEFHIADTQSTRSTMEDDHFHLDLKYGLLVGVLDGHSSDEKGKQTAEIAKKIFLDQFEIILKNNSYRIHETFEEILLIIQTEIIKIPELNNSGTTAVICYIDKKTKISYTATVGDSKAFNLRAYNGKFVSFPLSRVKNWASNKDIRRVTKATLYESRHSLGYYWRMYDIPEKSRRVFQKSSLIPTPNRSGLNVSRSLGNHGHNIERPVDVIIAKPNIIINKHRIKDRIVIATDGLLDYADQKAIVNCFEKFSKEPTNVLCKRLVDLALAEQEAWRKKYPGDKGDNITVAVIKF